MRHNDLSQLEAAVREANPVPRPLDLVDSEESAAVTLLVQRERHSMATTPALRPEHTEPGPPRLRRQVWAFAAAFVGVFVAVGLAALLLSDAEAPVTDQPPPTTDQATTTTSPYGWPPFPAPAVGREHQRIVAPDGTEWMSFGGELHRYDGTQFTSVGAPKTSDGFSEVGDYIAVTADGTVWASGSTLGWGCCSGSLARFDGTNWELMRPLGGEELPAAALAATPDGSLWALIIDVPEDAFHDDFERLDWEWTLARYDGGEWTLYPEAAEFSASNPMALEAHGNTVLLANGGWEPHFMGVVVYDGQSWRHYLEDVAVMSIRIWPNGTVWADDYEGRRHELDL